MIRKSAKVVNILIVTVLIYSVISENKTNMMKIFLNKSDFKNIRGPQKGVLRCN